MVVNRKDKDNRNIFQGGFLGLIISAFWQECPVANRWLHRTSRRNKLDGYVFIEYDAYRSWTGKNKSSVYEDMATKFFEHFLLIAGAMNNVAEEGISLWDDEDEFSMMFFTPPETTG